MATTTIHIVLDHLWLDSKNTSTPPPHIINRIYRNNLLRIPPPFSFCNGLRQPFSLGWLSVYPKTSQEQDYVKYPSPTLKTTKFSPQITPVPQTPNNNKPDSLLERRPAPLWYLYYDVAPAPHAPQRYHRSTSSLNNITHYFHYINDSNHPIPRPSASSIPAATSP